MTARLHLTNGRLSLILRVFEDGTLGQLHLGAPLPTGRSYRHLGPDPFEGFANRVGDSDPARVPDGRAPATSASPPSWSERPTARPRSRSATSATGRPRASRRSTGLPSTYVEADGEAETLTVTLADEVAGIEADLRFTVFRDHAAHRPQRHDPRDRHGARRGPDRDERVARPARRRLGAHRAHAAPGRASATSPSGRSSRAGRRSRAPAARRARQHNPFLALRRAADRRGPRRGLRVQPRLLGQLPRRGRGRRRSTRPGSASASSPRPSPGPSRRASRSRRPRRSSPERRRSRRPVATRSTGSTASGSPAAPGATGRGRSWSTTGRGPTSTSTRIGSSRSPTSARDLGVELFVLDDGWFGARNDDTTSLGDWFVDRASCPTGSTASRERIDRPRARLRALDRAGDGQRGERAVPRPPGLGDRHPRPAADREPPAAGPRPGPRRGRRPPRPGPRPGPRERADLLHQVGHEPQHHRAVRARAPARAPGRVLPPLHPRRVRAVPRG